MPSHPRTAVIQSHLTSRSHSRGFKKWLVSGPSGWCGSTLPRGCSQTFRRKEAIEPRSAGRYKAGCKEPFLTWRKSSDPRSFNVSDGMCVLGAWGLRFENQHIECTQEQLACRLSFRGIVVRIILRIYPVEPAASWSQSLARREAPAPIHTFGHH